MSSLKQYINNYYHNDLNKNDLCKEWLNIDNFITWCLKNGYTNKNNQIYKRNKEKNLNPNNCIISTEKEIKNIDVLKYKYINTNKKIYNTKHDIFFYYIESKFYIAESMLNKLIPSELINEYRRIKEKNINNKTHKHDFTILYDDCLYRINNRILYDENDLLLISNNASTKLEKIIKFISEVTIYNKQQKNCIIVEEDSTPPIKFKDNENIEEVIKKKCNLINDLTKYCNPSEKKRFLEPFKQILEYKLNIINIEKKINNILN